MTAALDELSPPEPAHRALLEYFETAAEAMRNHD
jgi:truncated hemoglobin YjbI